MKKTILILISILIINKAFSQDDCNCPHANQTSVELTRALSKDIFDLNGVPFMQPLVQAINATSNSRFFSGADIPVKVDKAYFRVSLNGMFGKVTDEMRSYTPQLPQEKFDIAKVLPFVDVSNGSIRDTAKLVTYLFRTMVYDGINGTTDGAGIKKGLIESPERAATVLGKSDAVFNLPQENMKSIAKNRIDYLNLLYKSFPNSKGDLINQALQDTINKILTKLPPKFQLPAGGDFRFLAAGVPQIEIGSLYGTEALIRFVPKINMGSTIGDFAFYGIGFKHSINQYFSDPKLFNLAIQAVYQYTDLDNNVGTTNSKLKATANIYNINIQASKNIKDYFDIYTGLSYDILDIKSVFTYSLSQETMLDLGLLENNLNWYKKPTDSGYVKFPDKVNPTPGYPGDTHPQSSSLSLKESSFRFVFGIRKEISNFAIFFDSNFSKFTVFSGGISYKF